MVVQTVQMPILGPESGKNIVGSFSLIGVTLPKQRMNKNTSLGGPFVTFNLVGQTMKGAREWGLCFVGLPRTLDFIITALSTGAIFQTMKLTVPSLPHMHVSGVMLT